MLSHVRKKKRKKRKLAAGISNGVVYLSSDSGTTFTPATGGIPSGSWRAITMNDAGSIIVAVGISGQVWLSYNDGVNWYAR